MTRMVLMMVILALALCGAPNLSAAGHEPGLATNDAVVTATVRFDDEDQDEGDEDALEEEVEDEDEGPLEQLKDWLEDLLGIDLDDLFGGGEDSDEEGEEGEDEGAEEDTGSF